jgi:hypothetical protein
MSSSAASMQTSNFSESIAQTVASAYRNAKIDTPALMPVSTKILGSKTISQEISMVPGRKMPLLNLLHKAAEVYSVFGATDPMPAYQKRVANLKLQIKTHRDRIDVLQKMLDERLTSEEQKSRLERTGGSVEYKELYKGIDPESFLASAPVRKAKKCTVTSPIEDIIVEFDEQCSELKKNEQEFEMVSKCPPIVSPDVAKLANIKAAYAILVDKKYTRNAVALHAEICAALAIRV